MSTKPTLEQLLADTRPHTTAAESARMLTYIESKTVASKPVASPYFSYYVSFKPMSYIALALVLLLGATGTVAASGAAKPGDLLFPIDRATEEVRLALASGSHKEVLQNQFIVERFTELKEIIDEETVSTGAGTSTNEVVVKPEGEARVANAVAVLATQLAHEIDSTKREQFLQDLLHEVSALRVAGQTDMPLRLDTTRVKIDDNRTEVKAGNERIKIEQKDGQVEIKYEGGSRSEDDGSYVSDSHREPGSPATVPSRVDSTSGRGDDKETIEEGRKSLPVVATSSPTSAASREERGGQGGRDGGHHGSDRVSEEGGHDD